MTTLSSSQPGVQPHNLASRLLNTPFLLFLKDLDIGAKLTVGFGIFIVLLFVSAGVSYLGSDQATAKINRTDDVRVPTALTASRAQANLLRMLSDVRGYLALGDQKYRASYQQSTQAFEANLAELDQLSPTLDSQNQKRLAELRTTYQEWTKLPDQLFMLRDDQLDREPAYRLLATQGTRYAGNVLININTMIEMQGQRKPATEEHLALLQDMARFQGNFASMLSALRGYVTTRNRVFRGEYEVNLTDNQNAWDRLSGKRSLLTPTQQQRLDDIAKNRELFLPLPQQMFRDLESERWREDLYIFSEQAVPQAEKMQELLNDLVADQQNLLTSDLADGRQNLAQANQLILASGFVALLIGLVLTYVARETIAGPIRRLTLIAEQIRAGHLEAQAVVESKDETGTLAETFNNMTSKLRQTLMQVRKEKKRADDLLEVVIPIGVELASEKNFNRLLEKMFMEAKSFCHADGGALYLRTEDDKLKYVILRDDSQQIALGGTTGTEVSLASLALYRGEDRQPNDQLVPVRVALQGQLINLSSAEQAQTFDLGDSQVYTDSCANSLLALPLKNSRNQVLGVLQLIDAQDPETNRIVPFDQNIQQMMESFSLLAVAALEAYIREQTLHQQIQQLKIEIDEVKRQKQVSEIVETDFFQSLTEKAQKMREQRRQAKGEATHGAPGGE